MRLYDAHNHLQDERFGGVQDELMTACRATGVAGMVVNGACESDWPRVLELARRFPEVIPSFGYHPWYLEERTPRWQETLVGFLDQVPSAIGEVGLDRWKDGLDLVAQALYFKALKLRAAAKQNINRFAEAIADFNLLEAQNTKDFDSYYNRAECYQALNKHKEKASFAS